MVRHSGFTNQKKQDWTLKDKLKKTTIDENLLILFPNIAQIWFETDTEVSYTLIVIEFEKTAQDLLNNSLFKKNVHLLDALQRVAKDIIDGWWHGEQNKKEKMKRTLVALSIKDNVNQPQMVSNLIYLSHYTKDDRVEYFYLTDEVKEWPKQQAKDFIRLIYERHFSFLNGDAWKKAFITQQEKQNIQSLYVACFKKGKQNKPIIDAAKDLIQEVGKDFLPKEFEVTPLDKGHFIGTNATERRTNNFTNSLQGFGVELGVLVLGYCVVQRKDNAALATLEAKISESNHLSNVLMIFIDTEEIVIQLWKGKNKLESKLGKNTQTKEIDINRVITTIRRFFQVSRNIKCSPQQLAEDIASKITI